MDYDDPPNKVIKALNVLVNGVKEIKPNSGHAVVNSYGDYGINYDLWYLRIPGFNALMASNNLLSKFYYMVKREGFTIPYPQAVRYEVNSDRHFPGAVPPRTQNRQSEMFTYLRSLSYFFNLNDSQIEQLASKSTFQIYGKGELITEEGKADAGLYAIYRGRVKSIVTDDRELIHLDKLFGVGEVFGEMALYPGEVSPITTIAQGDVELAVIPAEIVVNLIQVNSQFSSEIIQFIEERKQALTLIRQSHTSSLNSLTNS